MKGMRLGREKTGSSAGKKPKKPDKLMRGQKKQGPSNTETVDLDALAESSPWFVDAKCELKGDDPMEGLARLCGAAPLPDARLLGLAATLWLGECSALLRDAVLDQAPGAKFWGVVGSLPARRAARLTRQEHRELFQHAKNRPGVAAVITGCEYGKAPHGEMEPVAISEDQEAAFLVACEVALEWQVPLVVTLRPDAREEELNLEAVNDCLAWLDKAQVPQSWPIHFASWGGPPGLALRVLKKYPRAMLGLNGALSFRSASHLRELAFDIPLDRILLESDAPSNSPADLAFPHSPWTVLMLVDIVAAQKRLPKEAVNDAVVANAGRLYSRSVARPVPEGFQMVVDAQEHATNASREPKDLEDLNELGKFL